MREIPEEKRNRKNHNNVEFKYSTIIRIMITSLSILLILIGTSMFPNLSNLSQNKIFLYISVLTILIGLILLNQITRRLIISNNSLISKTLLSKKTIRYITGYREVEIPSRKRHMQKNISLYILHNEGKIYKLNPMNWGKNYPKIISELKKHYKELDLNFESSIINTYKKKYNNIGVIFGLLFVLFDIFLILNNNETQLGFSLFGIIIVLYFLFLSKGHD